MSCLLLLPIVLLSGFDLGGRVGATFPSAGLETYHASSALLGGFVGYSTGRSRFELGYSYSELPGRQASPYHMDIQEATLAYGYEFVQRPGWGFEASAAAGYALVRRALLAASESGKAQSAHIAVGFVQHQGKSRLSLGFDNCVFVELARAGTTTRLALSYIPSLRAGVAYAF